MGFIFEHLVIGSLCFGFPCFTQTPFWHSQVSSFEENLAKANAKNIIAIIKIIFLFVIFFT